MEGDGKVVVGKWRKGKRIDGGDDKVIKIN
jgi:hypothetical protein